MCHLEKTEYQYLTEYQDPKKRITKGFHEVIQLSHGFIDFLKTL